MMGLPPAVSLPWISRLMVGCVPTLLCPTRIPKRAARSGIVSTSLSMILTFIVPALLMPVAMMPLPAMSLIMLFEMVKLELVTSVFAPVFPPKSDCTPMPLDPDGFAPWSMLSMTLLWTSPLNVPLPPKNTEMPKPSALVIGSAGVPLSRMRTLAEAVRPTAVTAIMLLPTLSMSLPLMTNGFGVVPRAEAGLTALVSVTNRMPLPPMKMSIAGAVSKNLKSEMVLLLIAPVVIPPVVPCANT